MSPDGDYIVFSSPRSGRGDIYRVASDGTNRVRLTDSDDFESDPLYSPDGSSIAYVREWSGGRNVWMMNADGSNQRAVTTGRFLDDIVDFSPDGERLYIYRGDLSTGMGRTTSRYQLDLAVVPPALTAIDAHPTFSPDGRVFATTRYNEVAGNYEVAVTDVDTGASRFIGNGYWPHIAPDNARLIYAEENTGAGERWIIAGLDGSDSKSLGSLHDARYTADGANIVYCSASWQRELMIMSADGTNRRRLGSPTGYITYLRPCTEGFICAIVQNDRVGDIYVVSYPDETVRRVASMK